MNVARGLLLNRLTEAKIGLSAGEKETTEQSNVFVFEDGMLTTFNGSIMVRVESPLDFDVMVNATDLLALISKIPDDEITMHIKEGELRIKGNGRSYGIRVEQENTMPIGELPSPSKWSKLADNTVTQMIQAARVCSNEKDVDDLTKLVHITPKLIEASDNDRLFRSSSPTGFPGEILIKAKLIMELKGLELTKVSFVEGWVYFKSSSGAMIALQSEVETYHDEIDGILEMEDAEKVTLPQPLVEIVERSEIFTTGDDDAKVHVSIADGKLVLVARKENGWARESKPLAYKGRPLHFQVNPKFLVEMLNKTRDVLVSVGDNPKMKMTTEKVQFVVCLDAAESEEE